MKINSIIKLVKISEWRGGGLWIEKKIKSIINTIKFVNPIPAGGGSI